MRLAQREMICKKFCIVALAGWQFYLRRVFLILDRLRSHGDNVFQKVVCSFVSSQPRICSRQMSTLRRGFQCGGWNITSFPRSFMLQFCVAPFTPPFAPVPWRKSYYTGAARIMQFLSLSHPVYFLLGTHKRPTTCKGWAKLRNGKLYSNS